MKEQDHCFRLKKYLALPGIFLLLALCSFQSDPGKPQVFTDNYKTQVTEGMYINCLTIKDLCVLISFTTDMNNYDQVKLELHRFGDDTDIVAADKTFVPSSKEFQKKYANKTSQKFKILTEENELEGSDLIANTKIFPANSTVNMIFCKSHDLKHCSFYVIMRGYKKTGEKTQFNEEIMDKGADLSGRSVVFKSWR
jgi:hypothetical protein